MKKEGVTAFAYRKTDGSIRHAHGILSDNIDITGQYFVYFDIDKQEERKFRIDAFIGIGEPIEITILFLMKMKPKQEVRCTMSLAV